MMKTLTLAALLLGTTTVAAQPAPDAAKIDEQKKTEAKALYDKGINHYNLGEFDLAITAFRQAYAIASAPGLLFNIAQAFRLKKDYEQASYFYTTYLRLKPDAANRADVEARIVEMNTLLEDQKKLGNKAPLGTLPPDGEKPTGPTTTTPPTTTPPTTTPPTTTPPATGTTAPTSATGPVDRKDGATHPGRTLRYAGIASASAGGALIITGIIFGRMASSAESDLDALNSGGTWSLEAQDKYDSGKRNNTLAIVSLIVGGAAVSTGAALWYLGSKQDKEAAVALVPTKGGAAFALGWKF